jgi:hypothetical protein
MVSPSIGRPFHKQRVQHDSGTEEYQYHLWVIAIRWATKLHLARSRQRLHGVRPFLVSGIRQRTALEDPHCPSSGVARRTGPSQAQHQLFGTGMPLNYARNFTRVCVTASFDKRNVAHESSSRTLQSIVDASRPAPAAA